MVNSSWYDFVSNDYILIEVVTPLGDTDFLVFQYIGTYKDFSLFMLSDFSSIMCYKKKFIHDFFCFHFTKVCFQMMLDSRTQYSF
jgi:hypothetical protein